MINCRLLSLISGEKPTFHSNPNGLMFKEMENIGYIERVLEDLEIDYDWDVKDFHAGQDMDAV